MPFEGNCDLKDIDNRWEEGEEKLLAYASSILNQSKQIRWCVLKYAFPSFSHLFLKEKEMIYLLSMYLCTYLSIISL